MLHCLLKSPNTAGDIKPQFLHPFSHPKLLDKKQKSCFEVTLNNEGPWFEPSDCEQCDKNLHYSVAVLVQIFHALLMLMGKNTENSLSRDSLSAVLFLFIYFFLVWHVCMCLEHTVCFSGSWRLFQIVSVPREHCACVSHMSNLSPSVLRCAGVTMYKGERFPLFVPLQV